MLPDRVSNPGPLTYESGALPIALRGPAMKREKKMKREKNEEKNGGGGKRETERARERGIFVTSYLH